MNIKQEENLLFEAWKKKQGYSSFISDGVFDEEEWKKQEYKMDRWSSTIRTKYTIYFGGIQWRRRKQVKRKKLKTELI